MTRELYIDVRVECTLDDNWFSEWEDLPPDLQAWWELQTETPRCEGSGHMGVHCIGCHFAGEHDYEEQG